MRHSMSLLNIALSYMKKITKNVNYLQLNQCERISKNPTEV